MGEHIKVEAQGPEAQDSRPYLDEQEERAVQLGSYQAARDELPIVERLIAAGQAIDKRQAWAILDKQRQTEGLSEPQRHFRRNRNHRIENSE